MDAERIPCLDDEINKWKYFSMTHSTCVDFYNSYQKCFFGEKKYGRVGAVALYRSDDISRIESAIKDRCIDCDALYALHYDINTNIREEGYERDSIIANIPVRYMQLGYYFYADRYLNNHICSEPDIKKYIEIEKALVKCIYKKLGVSVIYLIDGGRNEEIFAELSHIYSDEGMEITSIPAK